MAITAVEMPSTNRSMTCRAAGSPDAASCRTASGVGFTNPSSRADAVTRRSPFHVDLEVATLHTDATLRGAVDMGLETARNAMFRLGVRDGAS